MQKLNLTKKIFTTVGLIAFVFMLTGVFGYLEAKSLASKNDFTTALGQLQKFVLISHANATVASLFKIDNNSAGSEEAVQSLKTNISEAKKAMEALSVLPMSQETSSSFSDVQSALSHYSGESESLQTKLASDKPAEAKSQFANVAQSFKNLFAKIEILSASFDRQVTHGIFGGGQALTYIILSTAVGFLAVLAIGFFQAQIIGSDLGRFVESLRQSGTEVKNLAHKMSSSNVALSSNATETASSLEETVASLEQLSSMISLNTENSTKVYSVSEVTTKVAEAGERNIQLLNEAMNEIKMDSKKMEDIVNVIDGISFQTNLLALNAAVEAARAGEQGKGFAVVADAVRSLALRSSTSAKEINVMIKDNLGKVERGSRLASECNESLRQICQQVKQVTELSGEIASASKEQTSGLKQINQAMIQLDSASQDNATAAENVALASGQTQQQSIKMLDVVAEMEHFIFGEGHPDTSYAVDEQEPQTRTSKNIAVPPTAQKGKLAVSKNSHQIQSHRPTNLQKPPPPTAEYAKPAVNVVKFKPKKLNLDMGQEPKDNKIKKIENF